MFVALVLRAASAQLWVLGIALTDIWNSGCAERLTSKLVDEEIFDAMRARFWKHNGMNVLVDVKKSSGSTFNPLVGGGTVSYTHLTLPTILLV